MHEERIAEIEALMASPDFWKDPVAAQRVIREYQNLKDGGTGDGHDAGSATIGILAGAGGDDAEDFARMLRRMYEGYAAKEGWDTWELHANENDHGGFLPAPGRFPMGNGPYGHADLLGSVENMGSKPATGAGVSGDGWFQFSFQEAEQASHPYGEQIVGFGSGAYRNHWAVGARCVKLN